MVEIIASATRSARKDPLVIIFNQLVFQQLDARVLFCLALLRLVQDRRIQTARLTAARATLAWLAEHETEIRSIVAARRQADASGEQTSGSVVDPAGESCQCFKDSGLEILQEQIPVKPLMRWIP